MNENMNEKQEKYLDYNSQDIVKYESLYNLKALKKNKEPSKRFIKYLLKDDKKIVKKTVVELESMKTDNNLSEFNKVKNISYEKDLNSDDFEKTIGKLIKISKDNSKSEKEREYAIDSIKSLLKENLPNDFTMNTNIKAQDISSQNTLLDTSENYVGFVYFFWSAETMNFKIIGLHSINPIFELVNVKQSFYLIKPAMITNDCPIYFCFDKIPFSISFNIIDDMIELSNYCLLENITSDLFYAMEKNKNYIRVYGFNKIPTRIYIWFLLILSVFGMFEYILLQSIFSGI